MFYSSFPAYRKISIHSLRVEGDNAVVYTDVVIAYFNPLPPCGGRRIVIIS